MACRGNDGGRINEPLLILLHIPAYCIALTPAAENHDWAPRAWDRTSKFQPLCCKQSGQAQTECMKQEMEGQ